MKHKIASLIAFAIAVLGLYILVFKHYIFPNNLVSIIIQSCSIILMIWARITFGLRSFHATANTTKGELVTTGPYHLLRHPIYAAIIYFSIACIISYPFKVTIGAVILICAGLFVRMLLEEKFLFAEYPEYAAYCKQAKRIIPYLF